MSRQKPKIPPSEPNTALDTAARVLRIEGEALLHMAQDLPADFAPAVEMILACKGRVIVSGIGKSGHIARKISSTFASTGTPSSFVHPSEASHGDLGMVAEHDICLLISNSGDTAELGDLIAHSRRFGINLIGISRRRDSALMRAANLRLLLPPSPEACALGMAPTTSTTLTLALGDALAVALMERRGFMRADFAAFHPGGKLGAQLAPVSQMMASGADLPTVQSDTPMGDVVVKMSSKGFGIACVLDESGLLYGVISDGDLRRHLDGLLGKSAREVANPRPKTIAPDALAAEAVQIMNTHKIGALVVTDTALRPVGLIRLHDCLRAGVI